MKIVGNEKAWAALLGGGTSTALTVIALYAVSLSGAIEPPNAEAITAAVTGLVASVVAAMSAWVASNTPAP
jgi:hypothetical protein